MVTIKLNYLEEKHIFLYTKCVFWQS